MELKLLEVKVTSLISMNFRINALRLLCQCAFYKGIAYQILILLW